MATQTNKAVFYNGWLEVLKEQEVDVLLKASDSNKETSISAHKLILSARSQVFKKMFESDKCKASTKLETIIISEFRHEELEAFVDFIYIEGSVLSEKARNHVMSLYCAADKYESPHLRDLCRDSLRASINSSNALKVLELAEIPFDKELTDTALNFINFNRRTISTSAKFKSFADKHPNLTVEIVKVICGTRY